MANKLLKTLTLDDTSFDILNDRLPKQTTTHSIASFSVPHNTIVNQTFFTATEPGFVFGMLLGTLSSNPNGYRSIGYAFNNTRAMASWLPTVSGTEWTMTIPLVVHVGTGDELKLSLRHNAGTTLTGSGRAFLVFIPDEPSQ